MKIEFLKVNPIYLASKFSKNVYLILLTNLQQQKKLNLNDF